MIVPKGLPTFSRGLAGHHRSLSRPQSRPEEKGLLHRRSATKAVSRPKLDSAEAAIEAILQAIKDAGYKAGKDIFLALDPAASEFYDSASECYVFKKSTGRN